MSAICKSLTLILLSLLWRFSSRADRSEGASVLESNIRVSVLSLGAKLSIFAVVRSVGLEICVHVPAELLGSSLRVVELLLGDALKGLQFVLESSKLLLTIFVTSGADSLSDVRVNTGRLGGNCDH